jgi:hypothetical protein
MNNPLFLTVLFLTACAEDSALDDLLSWEELAETDDEIKWTGTIYDGPYTGENEVLTGGSVVVEDLFGAPIAEGEEPYASSEGYWQLTVPPSTDVVLRLTGESMYPTLWQVRTPARSAYWYSGGLFAYSKEVWGAFFEEIAGELETELGDDTCWVWGVPYDSSAWAGASVTISSTDGEEIHEATPLLYSVSDAGGMTPAIANAEVDYFFAFDLVAGDVSIEVNVDDGRTLSLFYPDCAGEVVSAWWLVLPEGA